MAHGVASIVAVFLKRKRSGIFIKFRPALTNGWHPFARIQGQSPPRIDDAPPRCGDLAYIMRYMYRVGF